jgi:hypothetical protein
MIYIKPKRIFEGSGLVKPEESYYVPIENVTNKNKQDIQTMIDRGRYFSIFAPRQSGKTTFLAETRSQLHSDPTYAAIILSFQTYSNLDKTQFYASIERYLYSQLIDRLKAVGCEKTDTVKRFLEHHHLTGHISFKILFEELNRILQFKKIVIFIDEFDGIPLKELGDFLTTLRELYQEYKGVKQKALYSVGLVGIRNITKLVVGGVSPFNIADQVMLPRFSLENVRNLFAQYTEETNQPFTTAAVQKVHEETAGQTWLVNRLGAILTMDIKPETIEPIDEHDVEKAIQVLLKERNDHFDNLDEKAKLYKESFVEIVFDNVEYNPGDESQTWLEQFGLVKNLEGKVVVSNNIYKARYIMTFFREAEVPDEASTVEYELPGNLLDMESVILDFEQYIAQIGIKAFYKDKKPYEKTGQFLLTAWLYRFVKGGEGDLRYESVSGLGKIDVILIYKGKKYIIENKVNHRQLMTTINKGVMQISRKYLSGESVEEGYLIIFDTKTPTGEECKIQRHQVKEKKITSFIIGIGQSE